MFDTSKAFKSYSGRPGCMCGCNGKYWHRKADQEFAGKNRGYAVTDDEVSDRAVEQMAKRIKNQFECFSPDGDSEVNETYAYVQVGGRANAVYFRK